MFIDIIILFFANKNIAVIIALIAVTKLFAFDRFLSEYFPIKVIVTICINDDSIIIEENNEKSLNTMYKYSGTNCLSIIWLVLKAYITLYLLLHLNIYLTDSLNALTSFFIL